jgi:hypothetical protein
MSPSVAIIGSEDRTPTFAPEAFKLVRDVDYFNDHYNPGDPIEIEKDFTSDIEEARLSTDYPEEPPTDQSDE